MNVNHNTSKETLKKIDITLTESSDRSESTSSEIRTENLISDYEGEENGNIFLYTYTLYIYTYKFLIIYYIILFLLIHMKNCVFIFINTHFKFYIGINKIDLKEKDNVAIQINKQSEKNNDDVRSPSKNFKDTIGTTQLYNTKKDDLVSDSGNSTGKDSKIIQLTNATNSLSATEIKMAEITQRFPLNQNTNETKFIKIKSIENDEGVNDVKSNSLKFELTNSMNDKNQTLLDIAQIKVLIGNHCDLIQNKMENIIKIKENILR